jgi:hypothetical protein
MEQVNREDWLDRELREAAPYIDDEDLLPECCNNYRPRGAVMICCGLPYFWE